MKLKINKEERNEIWIVPVINSLYASLDGRADDRSLVESVSDEVGEILCNLINGFRIFCSFVTRWNNME